MASMRRRIITRKSVLFDADMIIKAYELGIWDTIVAQYDVFTTEYICLEEAKYFKKKKSGKLVIKLKDEYLDTGRIKSLTADTADAKQLSRDLAAKHIFGDQLLSQIDPGEHTALAVLNSKKRNDLYLCTGDGSAIIAAVVLGFAPLCISLESILSSIGVKKRLKHNCTEKHLNENRANGISCIRLNGK